MSENLEFPQARYDSLLKTTLDIAHSEYKLLSLDWRNRQNTILKTYLWISVTQLAAQISFTNLIIKSELPALLFIIPNSNFYTLLTIAMMLSLATFILGINALRGPLPVSRVHVLSYSEMCDLAYQECTQREYAHDLYVKLIKEAEIAINHQIDINTIIGKKLRYMSCLLLLSLFLSLLALFYSKIMQV